MDKSLCPEAHEQRLRTDRTKVRSSIYPNPAEHLHSKRTDLEIVVDRNPLDREHPPLGRRGDIDHCHM
jgi:hypothetical protein